jgi:hypothetical protein
MKSAEADDRNLLASSAKPAIRNAVFCGRRCLRVPGHVTENTGGSYALNEFSTFHEMLLVLLLYDRTVTLNIARRVEKAFHPVKAVDPYRLFRTF